MKNIMKKDYQSYMGILIDVRDPVSFNSMPTPNSINIYYDKLLMNYKTLLDRNKSYYITCKNGKRSKDAVRILEYYGYDVTNVIN